MLFDKTSSLLLKLAKVSKLFPHIAVLILVFKTEYPPCQTCSSNTSAQFFLRLKLDRRSIYVCVVLFMLLLVFISVGCYTRSLFGDSCICR